ncbi:hypothetical protein J3F84DRAFT_387863 [Trichoderma pleuroticola]
MQPQDIRLRLVIRRHGLPEVKLLWPCSCSEDLTIARVLEQVNEVVPLESGEWGLEDYAVELGDGNGETFECLHFQQVGRILKDEDQVLIRSLLTEDLKRRRLSGRHQISDDGRHLVDGLPFGRSWRRPPHDRPHIELPPRKRIRVFSEAEDDDEEEQIAPGRPPPFYAIPKMPRVIDLEQDHYYDDDDEDDDEDVHDNDEFHNDSSSVPSSSPDARFHVGDELEESEMDDYSDKDEDKDEDEEDLQRELQLLREEAGADINSLQADDANSSQYDEEDDETDDQHDAFDLGRCFHPSRGAPGPFNMATRSSAAPAAKDYTNVPVEILMTVFQTAFPELSADIRVILNRTNKDLRKAYLSLSMLCEPLCTFDQMMDDSYFHLAPFARRDGSGSVTKPVEQSKLPSFDTLKGVVKKPMIEEVDDSEDSTTNGVPIPPAKKQSRFMASDKSPDSNLDDAEVAEDSKSDSQSDEESESSSDSSDDSLDSESSSKEEDCQVSNHPAVTFANNKSSDVSSNESSDDDSDSSSIDAGQNAQTSHKDQVESSSDVSSSESSESDSTDNSDSQSESEPESESESESESEFESEVEEISSKQPVLVPAQQHHAATAPQLQVQTPAKVQATGLTRTQRRNARRRRLKALKGLDPESPKLANSAGEDAMSEDFLARKKALLAAILDETHEGDDAQNEAEMEDAPSLDAAPEEDSRETDTNVPNADEAEMSDPKDEPAKRHARVDMGAGRRLVFGALGLKAPANKADEQKIRDSLMKDVRPLVNPRVQDAGADDTNDQPQDEDEDEDADAWRENIIYKAVECCHENMTLSEPPFPFVQRWDPQQNYGAMKKRKRASQNYQADTSYDDSTYYYGDEAEEEYVAETRKKSKKKKGKSASLQHGSVNQDEQDVVLDYDEAPAKSSQFTDVDDLPSLPRDVKALPLLEPASAKHGMVITWNQLVMSKATNWQPEMLPVTGLIVPGGENGAVHVILARRDREDNEKTYDEITGERVYGKFEVPDDPEEGGEEEDTGFRSLQWADMIEPRILQQAPADEVAQISTDAVAAAVEGEMPSAHDKVSEFQSGQDSLESGFSTGQVRAAVEDELMHDSLGTQANLETASIQSGQRLPRLDLSMSEVQISTASNSFEHIGHHHPKAVDAQSEHVLTAAANPQNAYSPKLNRWIERGDETAADQEAELGPSLADAAAEDVSNSGTLASKKTEPSEDNGGGKEEREEQGRNLTDGGNGASMASDSNLVIASSQFSIPSGRQPRTSYSLAEGAHDTIIPETLPQLRETTPIQSHSKSQSTPSSPASSSPFPSLEQIFMSAQATQSSGRKRETPSLSASQSVPARDVEYEEAMRKLDEGHESDAVPAKEEPEEEAVGERKLFPNATQPSLSAHHLDQDLPAPRISLSQSDKAKEGKSQFAIPAGSQIIVLSSSPASSVGVPDEINESESEKVDPVRKRGLLPTGPGWVRKGPRHERDVSGNATTKPAVAAPSRASRRRRLNNEALAMAPLVSPVSKHKGRRGRQNAP